MDAAEPLAAGSGRVVEVEHTAYTVAIRAAQDAITTAPPAAAVSYYDMSSSDAIVMLVHC